ncbi:MAG: hypothetical protein LBT84_07680, partial [Spirochaetia bacterium]|nr:hypothetical protein [Spirochaetia bacterium]
QDAYESALDDAKNGRASVSVKKIIEEKSIIPCAGGFDAEKIKSEKYNKRFCADKIRTSRARISALAKSHKAAGITLKDYPLPSGLAEAVSAAEKSSSVIIGAWTMTADNFEQTDRKAVLVIEQALSKSLWRQPSDAPLLNEYKISLEQESVTLRLPELWSHDTGRAEGSFRNIDNSARIKLTSIPLDGKGLDEISWQWISRGGAEPVSGKWGKNESGDYFNCVAKKDKDRVKECYIIKNGDRALIIEGETDKAKYNFFAGRFETVFKSISVSN